jgi:hypothetical protein
MHVWGPDIIKDREIDHLHLGLVLPRLPHPQVGLEPIASFRDQLDELNWSAPR